MAYDPKAIANYFLDLADSHHQALSPMKIQKLIYYANGWCLAIKGQPLINEQVEAWRFGPVIPSIYRELREFGNKPITGRATDVHYEKNPAGDGYTVKCSTPSVNDDEMQAEFTKSLLDKIWEVYEGYSASQLSNMTHAIGSPWHKVYTQYGGMLPKGTDIPIETIGEFFSGLYEAKDGEQ